MTTTRSSSNCKTQLKCLFETDGGGGNGESNIISITPNHSKDIEYKCLFCTLSIDDGRKPIGCPIRYVEKIIQSDNVKHIDKHIKYEFFTVGTFCSYNCAAAYATEKMKYDHKFSSSHRYLAMMYSNDKYGHIREPVTIRESPSPEIMICYGGILTEKQYKNELDKFKYISNGLTTNHPMTHVMKKIDVNEF